MTPSDLEAIRARDAADMEVLPSLEAYAQHVDDEELRNAIHMLRDRRALLAYVDELRKAAGKVTCWVCQGTGIDLSMSPQDIELLASRRFQIEDIARFSGWPVHNPPCYACADLRRLLGEKT